MNSVYKKSVSLMLCAVMASSGMVLALDGQPSAVGGVYLSAAADNSSRLTAAGKPGTTKDETVYVFLNPDGSVRSQTVSCWLHNPDGLRGIGEAVRLSDVKNVKSDLAPNFQGGVLGWDTDDTDVYYQGQTDLTPPVTMAISYTLDGKGVSPAELAGKSGRVSMTIRFTNNTASSQSVNGKTRTLYTPFAVAAVCNLPTDTFKNVDAGGLPLVTEGNNQAIAIAALPGLRESLGDSYDLLRDEAGIELQDAFTISADTIDFSMGSILAAVTSDLPLDSLKKAADFSELTDALDEMQNAAGQLNDGSAALSDGMGTFSEKIGELVNGIDALANGVDALAGGAGQLTDGAAGLKTGADALRDGIKAASGGAKSLQTGVKTLQAGAADLKAGTASLNENTQNLKAGASQVSKGVRDYTGAVTDLFSSIMGKLPAMEQQMSEGQAAVTEKMTGVAADAKAAGNDMEQIMATLRVLIGQIDGMEQAGTADKSVIDPLKSTALTLYGQLGAHIENLQTLGGDLESLAGTARQVNGGLNEAYRQMKEQLVPVQQELAEKSAELADGAGSLAGGTEKLAAGTEELQSGAAGLAAGTDQAAAGTDSLTSGTAELESGASILSSGAGQLQEGVQAAGAGASALQAGKGELQNGASQLGDAAGTLREKTGELRDGMAQFKTDGVDKMHDQVGGITGDLQALLDVKDALVERAESYTSYTGSPEGAEGSVKFILKTDAVEKEVVKEASAVPEKPVKTGFWQRIVDLFKKKD